MDFTSKDLVAIIKAMQGTEIRSLEYKGLIIKCDDPETATTAVVKEKFTPSPLFPKEDLNPEPSNPDDIEQTIQHEIENDPMLQDLERMNLMIQDPKSFELMMDREDDDDAENDQRIEQPVSKIRDNANDSSSRATNERLA